MAKIPHEITLIAFERQPDGNLSVCEVVETSFRLASYFAHKWYHDRQVYAMTALAPGKSWAEGTPREIRR